MTIAEIKAGINHLCMDFGYETCDGCPFVDEHDVCQLKEIDDMEISEIIEVAKLIKKHQAKYGK